MSRILIADDEERIRDILKEYLEFEGFDFAEVSDGVEAVNKVKAENFDLVILDIMMPKVDGFTVLREIRKFSQVPVIMLSARGEEYDKLFGFEMGVDDYITKPFSPKEVVARIKAVLKRISIAEEQKKKSVIKIQGLEIDEDSRKVTVDGVVASLTPKEFDILVYMAKNKGIVLTREKLLEKLWGYEFFGEDRTIDTHIKMLRNSLGKYRKLIITVWKKGYMLEENNEENQE